MRSFLAALALLLAAVLGTVALTSYVASQTALSRDSSGRLLSSALQQPALRHRVLAAVVPEYDALPAALKQELNRIAQNPRLDAAVSRVRVDAHGVVHLDRLRKRLEQELRAHGEGTLATVLATVGGPSTVRLPGRISHDYAAAHRASWRVARWGGALAVALMLLALLISPHRRRTFRGCGWVVLFSCAATAVIWWLSPAIARAFASPVWAGVAEAAKHAYGSTVIATLVPVAIAGGVVLVVSFLLPRGRRR